MNRAEPPRCAICSSTNVSVLQTSIDCMPPIITEFVACADCGKTIERHLPPESTDEALDRALERAIIEMRRGPGSSTDTDEALERALVAAGGEVVGMVRRVGDALHAAGLEPSADLSRALLFLGCKLARGGAL